MVAGVHNILRGLCAACIYAQPYIVCERGPIHNGSVRLQWWQKWDYPGWFFAKTFFFHIYRGHHAKGRYTGTGQTVAKFHIGRSENQIWFQWISDWFYCINAYSHSGSRALSPLPVLLADYAPISTYPRYIICTYFVFVDRFELWSLWDVKSLSEGRESFYWFVH